jgi:DNA-binding response OmpR family regulator
MYILIVEDDPFLSYDLKEALLILHHDVREADSVGAAMVVLARGLPYFAVLDYELKTETSAAIAARLARENVPFCYVTADGDGVRGDPSIPDCPIVNKPYRVEDVTQVAARLLKP